MRQYDVYLAPGAAAQITPYVVVLTSHYMRLRAVLVAPMLAAFSAVESAELMVRYEGAEFTLSLLDMAAVEPRALKHCVGSLADQEDAIRRAVDRLFTGF